MRAALNALTDELKRLKASGVKSVVVSEESLATLHKVVSSRVKTQAAQEKVAPNAATAVAKPEVAAPKSPGASAPLSSYQSPPAKFTVKPIEPARSETFPPPPVVSLPQGDKQTRWNALRELVVNHPVCSAHLRPGKLAVLGVGNLDAKVFFCGEAPGAEEEVQGEPFVGPAGQLLTRMIQGMGLRREDVYIGNIMNWRPEMPLNAAGVQFGNRPPTAEELAFCLPFLRAQLEIVQPELIVALGATAAGGLLGPGTFKALGEIRGRWHTFSGIPLMVTYHPSYILRNQSNRSKRMIWEDLLQVMERAKLPISEKQKGYFLG